MTDLAFDPTKFWEKVDQSAGPDGCWLWTAGRNKEGYGNFAVRSNGRATKRGAHRLAFEMVVGPVPDGLHLDHLCRVRHCVNPAHLEPVTCRVNLLRGTGWSARNAAKSTCPRGHSLVDAYIDNGGRRCRTCRLAAVKASRQSKAA